MSTTRSGSATLTRRAGSGSSSTFVGPVPAGVESTNYLGNSFLFQSIWHDPGLYIDRSVFVFEVT
jgi:hypothetical protein